MNTTKITARQSSSRTSSRKYRGGNLRAGLSLFFALPEVITLMDFSDILQKAREAQLTLELSRLRLHIARLFVIQRGGPGEPGNIKEVLSNIIYDIRITEHLLEEHRKKEINPFKL